MVKYLYLAIFALLPLQAYAATYYSFSGATAPAIRAYNLNDMEGVDTQLGSSDGSVPAAQIVSDMNRLGIWNYRDADFETAPGSFPSALDTKFEAVSCPSNGALVNHVTLLISSPNSVGSANLKSNGTWPLANRLTEAKDLDTSACAGMVSAVEGPNEINNFPIEYDGYGSGCVNFFYGGGPLSGCSGGRELIAAESVQKEIYAYVHQNMPGVAVDNFTGSGQNMAYYGPAIPVGPNPSTASGYADYNNAHPYPQNGSPPSYWTNRDAPNWVMNNEDDGYTTPPYMTGTQPPSGTQPFITTVNQPAVTTEGGYPIGTSNPCAYNYDSDVTADIAGKQTLMVWLDGVFQGYSHVFIYKLINGDGSGFGFFDSSDTETLQGTDTAGMNTIIKDNGSTAQTFPLYATNWTATATANNGIYAETIELADGDYLVAVWQEAQICNNATGQQVAAPSVAVTFTASGTVSKIWVYDPTVSNPGTPVYEVSGSRLTFSITDHPVFFHVFE